MARYQLPPGPGRPRGRKNSRTLLAGGRLDELVPDERLIRLLIQLAEGRKRKVLDRRGRLITVQDRGDGHVATWLGDRKWGRMQQPIAGANDGPAPCVRLVVSSVGIPLDDSPQRKALNSPAGRANRGSS